MFHVVDALAVGGAERMAVDLANGLHQRGWRVHVVATRSTGPMASELDSRIPLHVLGRASRFDLGGLREFRRLMRLHHPQLVHAHGWSSLQFSTAGSIFIRQKPALVFHDHRPAGLVRVPRSYRASVWPLTRAHIAVDEALFDQAPPTFHRAIRAVVPNGSSLGRFRRKQVFAPQVPARLVMVANLRPQKAHPVLFEALALLASRGVTTRTDLLGARNDADYLADCNAQLGSLAIQDCVSMAGTCEDVGAVLSGYDLGVLSSDHESGPVALIEYLAAGLPFVVTDVGNVTRALPPRLRKWTVEPGDAVSLADRIEESLHRSDEERRADALAGLEFAQSTLSIDRTVDGTERVYEQLLDRPR